MVHLILTSTKGNGIRHFPFTGYLGLTPVKVEGVIITKRDNDQKLLPAKSITVSVRCYESRLGRVGIVQSNVLVDYTQVLWSKPEGQEYADVGDSEYPFRISIPVQVGGFSSATFVEYRCTWRVEAIINHVPITGIGTRQIKHAELALTRYDLPSHLPSPCMDHDDCEPQLHLQTNKPRAPSINYCINVPSSPVGPMDLVTIPIILQPSDSGVVIRSASVVVERRIQLNELTTLPSNSQSSLSSSNSPQQPPASPSSSPPSISIPNSPSSSSLLSFSPVTTHQDTSYNGIASTSTLPSSNPVTPIDSPHHRLTDPRLLLHQEGVLASTSSLTSSSSSSNPTITPHTFYPSTTSVATEIRPLLPRSPQTAASAYSSPPQSESLPSKIVSYPVTEVESSGPFIKSDSGIWSKTLTLQWPSQKSSARWAIGETIRSDLVSVRYFVCVKIIVATPAGTDTLDLQEKEIHVVSTNDAERRLALSKYNDAIYSSSSDHASRSKSKSPRRSRKQRDQNQEPNPPIPTPSSASRVEHAHKGSTASSPYPNHAGKHKTPSRRPHTSAGPRDKIHSFTMPRMDAREHQQRRKDPSEAASAGEDEATMFRRWKGARAETVVSSDTAKANVLGYLFAPRMGTAQSGSSTSSTSVTASASASTSSISSSSQDSADDVKEWEEELAKIEARSRNSSDMLGFTSRRKRDPNNSQVQAGR